MSKYPSILLSLVLYVCGIGALNAENAIAEMMSAISTNNPDIKAANSQLARDSIDISSTNYLEDPTVDFEYLFGAKSVGDKWAIGVSQGFEWPGIYAKRKRANKSRLNALAYSANMKRLEVLYQAKLLCLDIINVNRQIATWQNMYNQYADLYDSFSKAFDKSEVTILDINKLRIELANVSQTLENLKTRRDEIMESLNALNGNNPLPIALAELINEYPEEDFLPLETYVSRYQEFSPEANYYSEMNNAYNAEKSVARMGWFPKFDVGYKYSNEIGDGFNGFTVGMSIPLFANKKKVKAAKAQEIANVFEAQSISNSETARIKSAFAKAVSLKSQMESYKTALDFEANQDLLRKALDSRQISLLDYIREMIYFMDAKNRLQEIEYEYYLTMAQLNKYAILN